MLNRRELLAGTLASGIAAQVQSGQAQAERRPNILHIMSDQQQWATSASNDPGRYCAPSALSS